MLRFVPRRLAVSAYTLFMREQKNHPKLKGLAVPERGRMTSKLYKALGPADRAALEKRAAAQPSNKRSPSKAAVAKIKGVRKPSAYAIFVKENIHKFDKLLHRDRMKAVAKLWKTQQQRTGK